MADCTGGFTTPDKIFINSNVPHGLGFELMYYICLHELAHYKRFQKLGADYHFGIMGAGSFEAFAEHVINEEIFADRYAMLMFYLGNKKHARYSQHLDHPMVQDEYKVLVLPQMFNGVEFNLEGYNKMAESLIL